VYKKLRAYLQRDFKDGVEDTWDFCLHEQPELVDDDSKKAEHFRIPEGQM
jgi:hypothetical protein